MHLQENTLYDLWHWGQGLMRCCLVPYTSCDLCTCKVLSCCIQWFRERSGSVVECLSRRVVVSSLTGVTVLCPWARHTETHCSLFSNGSTKEDPSRRNWKIADRDVKNQIKQTSNGLGGDAFTRLHYLTFDIRVTHKGAQYPLYHLTCAPAKLLHPMV